MRPSHLADHRPATLRVVAGLLALVAALHGIGAAVLATLGPLHGHRPAAEVVVLDDLRRSPAPMHAIAERAAARRHGHEHGTASAERHHHAAGDASVELADGAALQSDADDSGATLAAFLALVPSAAEPAAAVPADVAATRRAWVPRTHAPEPFERPPRSA